MKKLITGNEAVALGAVAAGVKAVTGYPGTPSTGTITYLLSMDLPDTHVEWSVNEKVAIDVAAGLGWGGHRVLVTMKMSGVNVAADSLVSIAHSGVDGGMVIYVADDPGVSAGMVEQDSRAYALMADMVILEPSSVKESYEMTKFAFDLSEQIQTPVFVRSVTALANSFAEVDIDPPGNVSQAEPLLVRDINRYTKAGSVIGKTQHQKTINNLEKAGQILEEMGFNKLHLSANKGGLGIITVGITAAYMDEAFEMLEQHTAVKRDEISILNIYASLPFPDKKVRQLLAHCGTILVLEELEPHLEKNVYVEAQKTGFDGKIVGKLDNTLSRIGEYGVEQIVRGTAAALGLELPENLLKGMSAGEAYAADRPITVCAGCPHRGTYMAIIDALRRLRLKKSEVMVTGDIGCTILGMNPPYDIIWNEISMGASVSLAQGYVYAGVKTPVIATIGDSTFFHGGIPGLINAIQHNVNMTLIIMDNRWTAMTGMQENPGTSEKYQGEGYVEVDIARIIPALGVTQYFEMDPFNYRESSEILQQALKLPGVKVVLARGECAIQVIRHKEVEKIVKVIDENCNQCKLCIMVTGCAALSLGNGTVLVDEALCTGCGLCVAVCNRNAMELIDREN